MTTHHVAQVAVETVSSQQHHMGFNVLCCFSIDTLLSFFHCLSFPPPCILVFQAFCVFSLYCQLCFPESLRLAVWSFTAGTLHTLSTSPSICSLWHRVLWGQFGLHLPQALMSQVSLRRHTVQRYMLPIQCIIQRLHAIAGLSEYTVYIQAVLLLHYDPRHLSFPMHYSSALRMPVVLPKRHWEWVCLCV